jgi:hypothetical protein
MPFSAEDLDQIRTAVRDVVDNRFNGLESRFSGLERDVHGLQRDVHGLQRDVHGLQREVHGVQREVQALVRNQPEVAFRHMQQHVVGKGTVLEEKAIAEGADSTWTYMKHGDKVLAVSAAHCACDHPIQQEIRKRKKRRTTSTITDSVPSYDITTKEFIEVPELLAPFVTSVFFLPDVVGDRHPSTYQDIVVVELQDEKSDRFTSMTESNSIPVWRTVAGQSDNIDLLGSPLAGVGLARTVHAPSCTWNQSKTYILFNPDTSEGGHSGTFVFDLQQRPETQLREQGLGVLIGETDPGGNVHPRGKVCPLPNFGDLKEYPVVSPPPEKYEFRLRGFGKDPKKFTREGNSQRFTTAGRGRKRKTIHGVFVDSSSA